MPWARAEDRLGSAEVFWLATTRRDGSPHVTPVWGVWIADAFYFSGIPTAAWARNLVFNPRSTIHLESGNDVLIVDGVVEDVPSIRDAALADEIVSRWRARYGRLVPDPAMDGMYRLRASQARGWSRFPHDATKWTFDRTD